MGDKRKKETWFWSDPHFFHKNILLPEYSNRPFTTIEEMNETLIKNLNEKVHQSDDLYILGDFIWGSQTKAEEIFKQIKCKNIYYILGNHDHKVIRKESLKRFFKWVENYKEISIHNVDDNSTQRICLFHYPILEWNGGGRGSWMLHGHTHGNITYPPSLSNHKIIDVGVDCWNYSPVSYTQLKEIFKDRQNIEYERD